MAPIFPNMARITATVLKLEAAGNGGGAHATLTVEKIEEIPGEANFCRGVEGTVIKAFVPPPLLQWIAANSRCTGAITVGGDGRGDVYSFCWFHAPIDMLKSLSRASGNPLGKLRSLHIQTALAFLSRVQDRADREVLRVHIGVSENCMQEAFDEALALCPDYDPTPQRRAFGALIPPDLAWQMGKTAATIKFVNEAERTIAAKAVSEKEAYVLQAKIDRLKDGTETLGETETVDEWLEQLRMHHP